MGRPAVFAQVVAPVRNAPCHHGRTHTLAAFCVGARAKHRVAIHHGRGLHPGAMFAPRRQVAHLVGRAGVGRLQTQTRQEDFALAVEVHRGFIHAHALGIVRRKPQLCVRGEGLEWRNFDGLVAVQTELAEHRIHAATLLGKVPHERRGGVDRSHHIASGHQALSAQRLSVANQQVHGSGHGGALLPLGHGLLFWRQLHGFKWPQRPEPATPMFWRSAADTPLVPATLLASERSTRFWAAPRRAPPKRPQPLRLAQ